MRAKLRAQADAQKESERTIFRLEAELRIARQREQLAAGGRARADGGKGGAQGPVSTPRGSASAVGKRAAGQALAGGGTPLVGKENSGEGHALGAGM